ncbi:MAG: hypothetical protein ABI835_19935 [Chloroflexota bacterium]
MEGLIRILILLFLLLTGRQEPTVPPPVVVETIRSATQIDSVEAVILESLPAQIDLVISGSQPDGCDFPVQVVQARNANSVTVEIFRDVPLGVMCPAMLREYHETIRLEGTFESGRYSIRVNDFELEVTV